VTLGKATKIRKVAMVIYWTKLAPSTSCVGAEVFGILVFPPRAARVAVVVSVVDSERPRCADRDPLGSVSSLDPVGPVAFASSWSRPLGLDPLEPRDVQQ